MNTDEHKSTEANAGTEVFFTAENPKIAKRHENYQTNPNVKFDFTNKFGPIPCVWTPVGWKNEPKPVNTGASGLEFRLQAASAKHVSCHFVTCHMSGVPRQSLPATWS
jgi:hypothetical protein